MARLLLIATVGGLAWYWWTQLRPLPEAERQRRLWQLGAWGLAGALLLLVLTGRVSWIVAPIAAAIPALRRTVPLAARAAPLFRRWWQQRETGEQATHGAGAGSSAGRAGPMTRDEALAVLGLGPDADNDRIRTRHRQLMQKLHPDRGGSDYLAAQLNRARSTLLGDA